MVARRPLLVHALTYASVGAAVAAAWMVFWRVAEAFLPSVEKWCTLTVPCDTLQLLVWPSSFVLLADAHDKNIELQSIAFLGNALLYGLVGTLAWLTVKRQAVPAAMLLAGILIVWVGLVWRYLLG